ncbi:MAG: FAD binding domain-containing protein [Casimicrobium sp.]
MKPAAFAYLRPDSFEAALRQLSEIDGQAKVIAGGQSLGPMLNMRLATPSAIIDLNDLVELALIRDRGDAIEVGAMTRHFQIAESSLIQASCPLLAQAARTIGHYSIRQRGTLGGSLANADPVAQLSLVAVTLQATIEVVSQRGRRDVPATEFFLSAMTTALQPDELIRSVSFPKFEDGEGSSFQLFNRRRGDYAIVAVAATVALAQDRVTGLRLGISGVGPVPVSLASLVMPFVGRGPNIDWIAELARSVRTAVVPQDEAQIPALYRQELAQTLTAKSLLRALERTRA